MVREIKQTVMKPSSTFLLNIIIRIAFKKNFSFHIEAKHKFVIHAVKYLSEFFWSQWVQSRFTGKGKYWGRFALRSIAFQVNRSCREFEA